MLGYEGRRDEDRSRCLLPQEEPWSSEVQSGAALHREPTGSSQALPPLPHTRGALHITSGRGVPWLSVQTLNPRLLVCCSAADLQHPLEEFMWSEALCAAGNLVGQVFEVKVAQSYLTFCDPHGLNSPWNSSGQNTGEGSLSLLQGIFPTRGLNPGLPHCRRILYQLSYQRNIFRNRFYVPNPYL